jgi:hypothetical protein
MGERFNEKFLDIDIDKHNIKELIKDKTTEYHIVLTDLIKYTIENGEDDSNEIWSYKDKVNNLFSEVVRLQKDMVWKELELAKGALEEAFTPGIKSMLKVNKEKQK